MRRLFTSAEAGLTPAALRWGERTGRWRRADRGVWAEGPDNVLPFDRTRAAVLATGGVASHNLAAVLYGLDGVRLDGTWVTVGRRASSSRARISRRDLSPEGS